jgi:hypothetical protein
VQLSSDIFFEYEDQTGEATVTTIVDIYGEEAQNLIWRDVENGDLYTETAIDIRGVIYVEVRDYQDYNVDIEDYESGRTAVIQAMSDYLYFSLDTWGRANPTSEESQCVANTDCFGNDFSSQKCCASIAIEEGSKMSENVYLYRCLDRGIVPASLEFTLIDNIEVQVNCDSFFWSGGSALAATFTAVVAFATAI